MFVSGYSMPNIQLSSTLFLIMWPCLAVILSCIFVLMWLSSLRVETLQIVFSCLFSQVGAVVVVRSLSHVPLGDPMDGSMPGSSASTLSHSLLKFMSIESVMLSKHLILSHPILLLPSLFPSIRVFLNESAQPTSDPTCKMIL
ncbi:unnamed protein product [Rangifer tarandus platyrhynchus]|uniref:Uncharacterized protein n=2 Tax=Rangifer tarandus platyrhynchus TaxID=3082113 RepID=A0ABN8ZT30_RANTA|nr:unnamed protein product [Rangifer tarandus platyrhynchus]